MDPLTLFALANGAVSAVKAGCKLYKDIKGAAGEVKDVLKDLDDQFKKLHPPEKPPTPEQKRQFIEEKERVKELNKKANEGHHDNIYREIGEHLGAYYDPGMEFGKYLHRMPMYTKEQLEKIYGPTGLDIGAETSEEIAVSIIAEIQAVFNHKEGNKLKNKQTQIHQ